MKLPSLLSRIGSHVCRYRWKILLCLLLLNLLAIAACWAAIGLNTTTMELLPESPAEQSAS